MQQTDKHQPQTSVRLMICLHNVVCLQKINIVCFLLKFFSRSRKTCSSGDENDRTFTYLERYEEDGDHQVSTKANAVNTSSWCHVTCMTTCRGNRYRVTQRL